MSPPSVRAWVRKAESDLKVARDELATLEPATDAVCFHCQQCAEKYLKAYLISISRRLRARTTLPICYAAVWTLTFDSGNCWRLMFRCSLHTQ